MSEMNAGPIATVASLKHLPTVIGVISAIAVPIVWCVRLETRVAQLEKQAGELQAQIKARATDIDHEATCRALGERAASAYMAFDSTAASNIETLMERSNCIRAKSKN